MQQFSLFEKDSVEPLKIFDNSIGTLKRLNETICVLSVKKECFTNAKTYFS